MTTSTTRVTQHIRAPRAMVYRAYHGHLELVPNEQIVEVDEFETADPAMQGEMTITILLGDANDGTELVAVHDGLPRGVSPADNETGWQMSLARLAAMVEKEARE